jgi:tRNA-guanine family transglycosylase
MSTPRSLTTPSGVIRFPAYIPVTTFGGKYPLDRLIQPYLPRLAPAVMVSHHYAKQMKQRPRLPVLIDSGGFAALFEGSRILEENGLGILETHLGEKSERLSPMDVLEFQEEHADVAFTLDFPIPPGMDHDEARKRQRLSIANAIWAIRNRRRKEMRLYACIQSWDAASATTCAAELAKYPFDGFAIGGLVPRARNWELIESIVSAVLVEIDGRPLHVFGLGKPETTNALFEMGVDSVDSSSYVKLAVDGKKWSHPDSKLEDPSTPELLNLAIQNLATASTFVLPLAAAERPLKSCSREVEACFPF